MLYPRGMRSIFRQWERVATSWRGLTQPEDEDFFRKYDAVIATTVMGKRRSYEIWTYGQIIGGRSSLADAKALVDEVYGPQPWRKVQLDPVTVEHYYFGLTEEFQDPLTIYVVDHLPSLL